MFLLPFFLQFLLPELPCLYSSIHFLCQQYNSSCKLLPLSFSSKLAFHWGCRAAIREGPVRELREGPIAGRVGSQPLLESPLATGPRHYAAVQSPDTGQPGP